MKPSLSRFLHALSLLSLLPAFPAGATALTTVQRYKPSNRPKPVAGQPYERFSTRDRFGREIAFYLSQAPVGRGPLPLVLYIEGSGCGSRFEERGGKSFRPEGTSSSQRFSKAGRVS